MVTEIEIIQNIASALKQLYVDDAYLIDNDVNERSVTHWMAVYLQAEFESWNVDCEYNRNVESHDLKKRLLPFKAGMHRTYLGGSEREERNPT